MSCTLEEMIRYYKSSHLTNEKRQVIAVYDKQDRTEAENVFLAQHHKQFKGFDWCHRDGAIDLAKIIRFQEDMHSTNASRKAIELYRKENRADEDDIFLSEHQRTFERWMVHQKYTLAEIVEKHKERYQHLNDNQKKAVLLFEKKDRTDEEDCFLADHQYGNNRKIWEEIQRQYDKYGERWY